MVEIKSSEITPEELYLSRRRFMKGAGALALGSLMLAACGGQADAPSSVSKGAGAPTTASTLAPTQGSIADPTATPTVLPTSSAPTDELGDELTSFEAVTGYNNFYEFTIDKQDVARLAENFRTSPWTVEVGGLVNKPKTFDLDDLRRFEQEERIYRLRCVEAWSMVIPWMGFPLSKLLDEVEPTSQARYVRFETLLDTEQMPGQKSPFYKWPYIEGLRVDEAMHDLTILATGVYGQVLPPQNGAPVRLVVPWKYGFKSIKSIVRIDLVEEMPVSLWMAAASNEYGFYANVNPEVPHPRWSQATERRIGEIGRRDTLFFNGYADEVAQLYDPLDSREWYY
jgi:sulfoxide reductase catalytic subunit YedY